MGYFSRNIPNDPKEAHSHAKKSMAAMKHAVDHSKKMVAGKDYITSIEELRKSASAIRAKALNKKMK